MFSLRRQIGLVSAIPPKCLLSFVKASLALAVRPALKNFGTNLGWRDEWHQSSVLLSNDIA